MSSDADLSLAERDALHAYARRHGRTWKSSLRDDWMRGRAEGPLQRIRNRLGPRWLAGYRLATQIEYTLGKGQAVPKVAAWAREAEAQLLAAAHARRESAPASRQHTHLRAGATA
jgi:hypothetical protein